MKNIGNYTYVKYLFTMRKIAEKANDGLCETDRDLCDVVNKMARLINAIRV
jgi:hypothetical protein